MTTQVQDLLSQLKNFAKSAKIDVHNMSASNSNNNRDTFDVDGSGGKRNGGESQLRPMLESGVIKAFVAGLVVGNLNKGMMMGFLIGALGGVYLQQNIAGVPNVTQTWRDLMQRWNNTGKK